MGRIRTIKPEFPQSETIGRLSRDARLLFIQLWTVVDDAGRCRAAPRMLASMLFPYDDDAPALIGGWLDELEREECIRRYEVSGTKYLDCPNWLKHQKISHASDSKLPSFDDRDGDAREHSCVPPEDSGGRARAPASRESTVLGPILGPIPETQVVEVECPREARAPRPPPADTPDRPPKAARATRIPDDFEFDEKTLAVGREEGLTDDAIRREERKFVDWARSAPRERGLKRDWQAAARNWLRKAAESVGSARPPPPGGNGSSPGGLLGAYQRAADRVRAAHDDSERRSDLLDRHRH